MMQAFSNDPEWLSAEVHACGQVYQKALPQATFCAMPPLSANRALSYHLAQICTSGVKPLMLLL